MALVINDRVKETSTTTGTGAFNLDGASQDFDSFASGVGASNTTLHKHLEINLKLHFIQTLQL